MSHPRNSVIALLLILSGACASSVQTPQEKNHKRQASNEQKRPKYWLKTSCTRGEKLTRYEIGDLVCIRKKIVVSQREWLEVQYVVTEAGSDDLYERGYHELRRFYDERVVERINLRRPEDAHSLDAPFVRIREKKYLADLDNDGYLEFAIFPFHPGSAIIMTARIYSLRERITRWGEGRYQFEGDTYVKLNCNEYSKFNRIACKKCE